MPSDIANKLARNSFYYAIKSIVALTAMLLVTPYILNTVGKTQYGVWALVGVMTSYAQLSDFGITESLVKYAAEYHAGGDNYSLNRLVNTALFFLLFLACVVGSILILLLPFITTELLKIPPLLLEEALLVFRLSLLIFLINMILGVFTTLIVSSQNIGYTCAINIASTIVGVAGTFTFIHFGWGLLGLVATNAIVALFTGFLNIYFVYKLFPKLSFNLLKWVDRPMFKQIFSFSWKIQTASLSQLLIFQVDRILLSRYLGLEAVAYYEVGSNIAFYAKTFLSVLFMPVVPAVSALQATNEQGLVKGLYNRSFKFIVMLSVPFCVLVIALANPFIKIWMGSGFELSALTLQLLIPVYLVTVLTAPGIFILNGSNRPDVAMRSALFAGLLNLLLCFTLVKTVGYFGLIIGITTSLVASACYFAYMLHKVLPGLEWGMYRKVLLKPFLFSVPVAMLLYYFNTLWSFANFVSLTLAVCFYLTVVTTLLLKSAYLDDFEQKILGGLFLIKRREC